jgi:hypothetical protein
VILVLFSLGNGVYVQEHMNRAWGAAGAPATATPPMPLAPNMALATRRFDVSGPSGVAFDR